MKNMINFVCLILIVPVFVLAGTPSIDGSFDGTGTWGSAVATADGSAGWSSVNIDKLYVTYDGTYAYFAASFNSGGYPADWMRAGFVVNTTSGGGSSCPWGGAVTFGHSNKPDFVIIGRLGSGGNYAEIRDWNGSAWDGSGTDVYDNHMDWATDRSYIEGRISLSTLGSPSTGDVQFYVSGNTGAEHGTFDAVPDDEVATGWNDPTTLDSYSTDISLPVELTSFTATPLKGAVQLNWVTESEIDNLGFLLDRSLDQISGFTTIADYRFVPELQGQGSVTYRTDYSYTDTEVVPGTKYYYVLSDVTGNPEHGEPVTRHTDKMVNAVPDRPYDDLAIIKGFRMFKAYPNPFNPETTLSYDLVKDGDITLTIYDIAGRKVKELFSGFQTAGPYKMNWQPQEIPAGVYFGRLANGDRAEIQKLILLK